MLPKYEYLDHTADVGFKSYGTTLEEVFAHAAEALVGVMTPVKNIKLTQKCDVTVEATDLETLMVHWLNELLYRFETEELLFGRFQVNPIDNFRLTATCWGEKLDPARHEIKTAVKAVTYHQLHIKQRGNHWESRVFLDI